MQVKPYKTKDSKKEQVATMFNNIAHRYDFLNHFLSLNIDKLWRKKLIAYVKKNNPKRVLDVATGTADLAIAGLGCNANRIDGIDISEGMLAIGHEKIQAKKLDNKIFLQKGDAENIPFANNTFDAITVGFGVRNFENLENGLIEMLRVLKPGGEAYILEFTMPTSFPVKQLYTFYFKRILPILGRLVSNDKAAYTYLPQSVKNFPQFSQFSGIMSKCGYQQVIYKPLTFGIACIYKGKKPIDSN